MNKLGLTCLLACLLLAACDRLECKNFRDGKYVINAPNMPADTIERHGSNQIERMDGHTGHLK